ncbi:MAG: nicotinamide-nucleotide amidohydrolase family protein [Sphaerochaetaceae bacterium]|nr:nicotinamide-nucleotide amidohydrolase family protein [Sphaerochaetaceae bacterium]
MKASVFVIGTELTRGIISDTHIPFLCSSLSHMGYSVIRACAVPDDGSIETDLRSALSDSQVILVTGGLGPTSDDMTRSIISRLCNAPLVKNQEAFDALYKRIGERIYGTNEVQTLIPQGFKILPNPNGTAAGFEGTCGEAYLACMPGPPREMRPMYTDYVEKTLSSLIGFEEEERDEYSVFLIAEAKLEELCERCRIEGVCWGTRFQDYRISLYVSGKNREDRKRFVEELRKLSGKYLIEEGDHEARDLFIETVKKQGISISCAESATGGLCAKLLTDVSGASAWFWGSEVTYTNSAKMTLLGVNESTIDSYTEVSSEAAREMAEGSRKVCGADFAFSITGIAGPTGAMEGKPVGTVYLGFSSKKRDTAAVRLNLFTNGRDGARRRFAAAAFILCRVFLEGSNIIDTTDSWLYI